MPFRFALSLSLALHLAIYAVADLAGLAAPPPPARRVIEAMLIVPEIAPPQEAPPIAPPPVPRAPSPPQPAVVRPPPPSPSQPADAPQARLLSRPAEPAVNFYPAEAVSRGIEGEALVQLELDPSGRILAAQLARSSGHAVLDEAALRAVWALKSVPGGGREALLPVRFRLR